MNELEKKVTFNGKEDGERIDLATIEARLAGYMQGIAFNLLQVGRCLVIAKEAQLVPHGKWEEWVRYHTGMSERRAQRLMQAVSIAPEGSRIAELPVSKIMALLPLPEEKREDVAATAIRDGLTVKQLQDKVAELTAAQDAAEEKHQQAIEDLRGRLQRQVQSNGHLIEEKGALEGRNRALEQQISEMENSRQETNGISPEAQARIDELQAQLKAAEDYAEEQAELRQQLEQGQLDAAISSDDTDGMCEFCAEDLVAYTATFLGRCGILAHMGPELSRMDSKSRNLIRQQLDYVDAWVKGAYAALGAYVIVEEG